MTDRELMQQALEALAQSEQWEQLYPGIGNPFKRPATREEKIVRPGVYEVPTTCPNCAKLKIRITTLEQGIRQVGAALKEAMT